MKRFKDGRDWFFKHRFGLFIHWGIYSVGGKHEQELQRYKTPIDVYQLYQRKFTADRFCAEDWLDMAQDAGMSYLVFTAKHHDGFCMWNTRTTDYQVANSAAHRDILDEIALACQRRNFPFEIYYSCVDWHHPAYPNLGRHHEIITDPSLHNREAYLAYVRDQLLELCTKYGELAGIWWDMNVPEWNAPEINDMIRKLQPKAVINNRGFSDGDYSTPERDFTPMDTSVRAFEQPTEACDSVGINSWGYRKDEDYYTPDAIKRRLTRNLARGGNYLLNVGPKPDGTFALEAQKILAEVGTWFKSVSQAITAPPLPLALEDPRLLLTGEGKSLNVILNEPLASTTLDLYPLHDKPIKATLLNTGEDVITTLTPILYGNQQEARLRITGLPLLGLGAEPAVIQLHFKQDIKSVLDCK